MGSRKGITVAAAERFRALLAIGESRREAKMARREETGERSWTVSTGYIHSYGTYQQHVFAFIHWAREQHGVNHLDRLDARADELASQYLSEQIAAGKSAYTVAKERSALRLFFQDSTLADAVIIPKRVREGITRSRGAKAHDQHFNPAHWPEHIAFAQGTGLRRSELRDLRIKDVYYAQGALVAYVKNGKGGREREVPVLASREQDVLSIIAGRDPDERVFTSIPKHMDVHSYRREYAQALYLHLAPGRSLPPPTGRLPRHSYERAAAQQVSWALGHNRVGVVLRHYLR